MLETVGEFSFLFFFLFALALIGLPLVDGYVSYLFGGKLKNYMVSHFRFRSQYWLGGLGVIIHELGHAFFALLFRHHITSATFLNFHSENGTLGSVETAWNPRSFYQRVGNFFIGIAPLFSGLFVFWLLITVLLHPVFTSVPNVSGSLNLIILVVRDWPSLF